MQGWLKIKNASKYADCSERTFRDWLKVGLRHVRFRGSIRIKPEWIDDFLMNHEARGPNVDAIVDDVMKGLCK